MNNIEFINDAYTKDNLRLPMIHFNCDTKDICVIFIHTFGDAYRKFKLK